MTKNSADYETGKQRDGEDRGNERSIWDINPLKITVELSEGSIRIRESCVYNGRIRVAKAMQTTNGPQECAWLHVQAEPRDGADVELTLPQAEELRDAPGACIQEAKDDE